MKTLTIIILLICYLISFANITFADEKSQAEKPVLKIKQILLPRVAEFRRIGSHLSTEQRAEQKKKREKRRAESRIVEKNKKLIISMAKTNDYVKKILKEEILNTPLKGMNDADYGRDCYAYELMNILKDIDKYELLNVIKTMYNSDKWDYSSKGANIRYCQKLRSTEVNQNKAIDKELLPLM
ncbi:hypothetical protein KAH27_09680, partial [bacterium]|nr:hypothetical protein [bacterium]